MAVATWVGGDGTGSEQTDYGRAANWSGGVVPDADDHVIVANTGHNCKLDANREAASLTVNSGATLDGSGAKLSIKSEGDSSEGTDGYAVNLDGAIAGNLDLEIQTPAATNIDLKPSPATHFVRNVTINHASCAAAIADGFMTITGNLTITAGSLNTGGNDLTVAGATSITGTLTCNASTVSLGSGKTDAFAVVVNGGGTFNGGSGTHTYGSLNVNSSAALFAFSSGTTTLDGKSNTERIFSTSATNRITAAGTLNIATSQTPVEIRCDDDTAINNLTMNSSSKILHLINFRGSGNSNPLVIGGDLTITAGTVSTRNVDDTTDFGLTVTGDCIVGDGAGSADTAVLTGNASAISLGSLTINSDGKYDATSGTTTITSERSGDFALDKHASGTFTHNSGTVTISTNTNTFFRGFEGTVTSGAGANALNNLIVNLTDSANYYLRLRPNSGTAHTILGDVTVTQGKLEKETNDHTLTINGDVSVGANGTLGHADKTGNDTFGSLTIESGGTAIATSGTTTVDQGSTYVLRNLGTYTHNSGTLKVDRSSASGTRFLELGSAAIHKLVIDNTATTAAVAFVGVLNCAGDLEVTNGDFRAYGGSGDVTIDGHVTIANSSFFRTETSQLAAGGVNASLGSLTINSGATYDATPLTTTITSRTSGGYSWYAPTTGSTFNHNNGLVKLTYTSNETFWQGTGFYDLEIAGSTHFEHRYDD